MKRCHLPQLASFAIAMLFVLPALSFAQITFEKTYGGGMEDRAFCVQQTSDGGFVLVGHTTSFGAGEEDVYVVRTDSSGNTVWQRTYGWGIGDRGRFVQETRDGGFIITGGREASNYSPDVYLVKTDYWGNVVWEKTYGGDNFDRGESVQQTQDGGYVVAGVTHSFGAGSGDIYLIKADSLGDSVWTRTYGGVYGDWGYSAQETEDGGYIVVGNTTSFGSGAFDIYLVKTDSEGGSIWTRIYGDSLDEEGRALQQSRDGGYIIAGETASLGTGLRNVYLLMVDTVGNIVWDRAYGSGILNGGYSIQQTLDDGYIVAGHTASLSGSLNVYLIKTDSLGDSVWTRTYGGAKWGCGYSVQQTLDGGYVIAGDTKPPVGGDYDVYLIKTDEDGLTGIEEAGTKSVSFQGLFRLFQNRPNPFRQSTTISYCLPHATEVTLSIHDITGRLVEMLVNETQQPGIHRVYWDGNGNPSGVYFYRLKAGDFVETRKMVVVE